jgi:methionyl-tRNA synthetase
MCNRVLNQTAPWRLIRSQRLEESRHPARAARVLVVVASELVVYLPGTARQLHAALGLLEEPSPPVCNPLRAPATGTPLPRALHLFPRRTGERS